MGKYLTSILERAVACARQGRTIASIGAYLTGAEQEQIPEIYSRLVNKEKIDNKSPITAIITSKTGKKRKISQSVAIQWFTDNYPRWSLPLQKKLKETVPPLKKTILAYGLKESEDLSDEFYIEIIKDVTNIPEEQAIAFYYNLLKPQMNKIDELSGMIEIEIKKGK